MQMTSRNVVLREERSQSDSRYLGAYVAENGDLTIEGQDLGSGVETFWGPGHREYEWSIVVRASHVPALIASLSGSEGSDILKLLASCYLEDERERWASSLQARVQF